MLLGSLAPTREGVNEMENVEVTVEDDNTLVLRIDLTQEIGFTKSFRSMGIGTTRGNVQLWEGGKPHPKGIQLNCSVFRRLTEDEKVEAEEEKYKARRREW